MFFKGKLIKYAAISAILSVVCLSESKRKLHINIVIDCPVYTSLARITHVPAYINPVTRRMVLNHDWHQDSLPGIKKEGACRYLHGEKLTLSGALPKGGSKTTAVDRRMDLSIKLSRALFF